jgi:DHA1 family bicyclomycin/chloramphenicol resistance-like MFS transporter
VIVAVAFALLPLSTDLYLATLPGLRRDFAIGVGEAQLTLSAFVVGFAFSQLVYGPLSDRFGRRPVLLAGLLVYVAATFACLASASIPMLVASRFVQAVGACSGAVIGRAIVRDVYGAAGAARMLGYITAGMAVGPILGPMLGGWIAPRYGWQGAFAVLAAIGVSLLAAVALRLPESNAHRDSTATRLAPLLRHYRKLFADRRYVGYALTVAFTYAGIFSFVSGSSFVLIEVLDVAPEHFGLLFGGAVTGYVATNLVVGRKAVEVGVDRLLVAGTLLCALGGIAMAALAVAGVRSAAAVVLPMLVFFLGAGFNMPSGMAGALAPYPKSAGVASALLGFLQMAIGAAAGFVVGRLHDGTPVPMAVAIGVAGGLAAVAFGVLAHGRDGRARA